MTNDGVAYYTWRILGMIIHESSNAGLIMEETSYRSRKIIFARLS
jgi:hypothetical protein